MIEENNQQTGNSYSFKAEFDALPLDQKFSSLFQMELTTLNEAVKYVADSSMKVIEKFGVAVSDFGREVEGEARKAAAANDPAVSGEPPPYTRPTVKTPPQPGESMGI